MNAVADTQNSGSLLVVRTLVRLVETLYDLSVVTMHHVESTQVDSTLTLASAKALKQLLILEVLFREDQDRSFTVKLHVDAEVEPPVNEHHDTISSSGDERSTISTFLVLDVVLDSISRHITTVLSDIRFTDTKHNQRLVVSQRVRNLRTAS